MFKMIKNAIYFASLFWICCLGVHEKTTEKSSDKEAQNNLGDSISIIDLGTSLNLSSEGNLGISLCQNEDTNACEDTANTEILSCIYDFNLTSGTPEKLARPDLGPLCSTPKRVTNASQHIIPVFPEYNSSFAEESGTVGSSAIDIEELEVVPMKSFKRKARQQRRKIEHSLLQSNKMMRKKTDDSLLKQITVKMCCSKKCLKQFNTNSIRNSRKHFWIRPIQDRIDWYYDKAIDCQDILSNNPLWSAETGKRICSKAFCSIYGIGKNFFYKYLAKFKDGARAAGKSRTQFPSDTFNKAMNWLQEYASDYGDRMPHTEDILLPYKTRKSSIWQKYSDEKVETMEQQLGCSTFQTMWQKHFPHLKIKKTNSFSKCTKCTSIERQLERTRDREERKYLKQLLEEHNERQMNERKYYYKKRDLSKHQPNVYLSIIIDGMDQSKTNIPHMIGRKAKNMSPVDMLQTHLTGVLCHGRNLFTNYMDLQDFKHDPNLVMNIVMRILYRLSRQENLPGILFLQADNCFRENKNKFVLGFCELLVRLHIFNEVHLSFLYVGHTHEDIDAGFSRIAETLRRTEAETLPEMKAIIPDCHQLKGLFNIKAWLEPYINQISHHSKPLHFKFCVQNKCVKAFYKGNFDQPWIVMDEPLLHGTPRGYPKYIEPNFEHINCDKMLKSVESWKILFSDEKVQSFWWKTFLTDMKEMQTNKAKLKMYSSVDKNWLLSKISKQPNNINTSTIPLDIIPQKLQLLLQAETESPQVTTKRKRSSTKSMKKKKTKTKTTVARVSTTHTLVHIPFVILEKIWYFVLIQAFLNYIGNQVIQKEEKSFQILWLKVLRKHIGHMSRQDVMV